MTVAVSTRPCRVPSPPTGRAPDRRPVPQPGVGGAVREGGWMSAYGAGTQGHAIVDGCAWLVVAALWFRVVGSDRSGYHLLATDARTPPIHQY